MNTFLWELPEGTELVQIDTRLEKLGGSIDAAFVTVQYRGHVYLITLSKPGDRPIPLMVDTPPFPMPYDKDVEVNDDEHEANRAVDRAVDRAIATADEQQS